MPLYMYQAAYAPESLAAQLKKPRNRIEVVGKHLCEAAGGKFIGGWLCFGEYDLVLIADMPDNESMAAVALAVGASGVMKASRTTALITGDAGVEALKKADSIAKAYKPAR